MDTTSNKPALMLELRELVALNFPEYAKDAGLVSAAMVGALGAAISKKDLKDAVALWSEMLKDKKKES
jgi:hypothetical protein